jgi:hypothetical protein
VRVVDSLRLGFVRSESVTSEGERTEPRMDTRFELDWTSFFIWDFHSVSKRTIHASDAVHPTCHWNNAAESPRLVYKHSCVTSNMTLTIDDAPSINAQADGCLPASSRPSWAVNAGFSNHCDS